MVRKIAVTTGTRAEYGILKSVLKSISKNKHLELVLIVTGTHLSKKYGMSINEIKKEAVFEITFAKPMDTSDIIIRAWDPYFNSRDAFILDAFEVVSEITVEPPTPTFEEPVIEESQSQSIPKWIKNNAAWWSDRQISDSDFVSGIEYLIKNGIINVPGVEVGTDSASTEIPEWIKNNAGWWADSLITDGDFTEAMQWLVANGVIQI